MNLFLKFVSNHKSLSAFIVFFLVFFLHLITSGHTKFYYDAENYWIFGSSFLKNGDFSLYNFNIALRGVWFPLLLYPLYKISVILHLEPLFVIRFFSAIYISVFITFLIPRLVSKIYPDIKITFLKIIIFGIFIFVFWRNYFNYPLTDFPSIILLIWSVYLLMYNKKIFLLFSGIFLGLAINIRPIYLIAVFPFFIFIIFQIEKRNLTNSIFKTLIKIALIIIGFLTISIPQLLVNKNSFGINSMLVQTNKSDYAKDLYLQQLIWGLKIEKYETNIGESYPIPQVCFYDKLGGSIAKKELADSLKNYNEYLNIYKNHPLELSYIYFKHFFNGLDIKDNTIYLRKITPKNYYFSFLNYTLLFAFFLTIYHAAKKLFNTKKAFFLPIIILSPALLSIPTAIETRFMLPLFLYAYIVFSYHFDYKSIFINLNYKGKIILIITYLIFIFFCFFLSHSTYSNLEFSV